MVTVTLEDGAVEIRMQGSHRLWAMRSSLRVPLADIREVRHDPERASRFFPGLRAPGTHIPFVYTAGTYYQSDFRPDFWAVRHPANAIVIRCAPDAAFDEIIVEVEDPSGTVDRIRTALPPRAE